MNPIESEDLDTLKNYYRELTSNSLNDFELSEYNLSRNDKLEIVANFNYLGNAKEIFEHKKHRDKIYPIGTVWINDSKIILKSPLLNNSVATFSGVNCLKYNLSNIKMQECTLEENCSIESITIENNIPEDAYVLIEWICNMNLSPYHWPNGTSVEEVRSNSITYRGNGHALTLKSNQNFGGGSNKCCHIKVQNYNIYFGESKIDGLDVKHQTGFIMYEGVPPEEMRDKIRDAISFLTGNNLLYLGYKEISSNMQTLRAEHKSPNTMGGLFRKYQQPIPFRLMEPDSKYYFANSNTINNIVNNFVDNYDKYDLKHISWLYWHAAIAPAHLRAVCFGAVLEYTQKKYIEVNPVLFKSKLLDKKTWKKISNPLLNVINSAEDISEEEKSVLNNKIGSLNITPQSILTKRFFSSIGLNLGDKEESAYSRRNDAAHGNRTPNDDYIGLIRESKILHILCNRVLIKILMLSDGYIDFYSINHPFREISDYIED
ncbi:hypothetical protein M2403_003641 [Rahnella sp. BIGb0603]|uniref:hypothetical protein n=1 Tax=Rahnella sp. BIGb0603 TaxID=2940612 RepID=UPI002168C747|nr:hypothetical protein [Rahnella sp. BIGb0603]MCS3425018.1 hypothetical protein [Rahnella sp. BIGb0603]